MGKIALVTDSTADIDRKRAQDIGITIVALNVHFGDEVFKDGVDLTSAEFFTKLPSSPVMPRTSQPSPGDFVEVYTRLRGQGYTDIISLHISSALSGTFQSATIASTMVEGVKVHVVDSKSASIGLGLMITDLAERLADGSDVEQLLARTDRMVSTSYIFFAVDTLVYLEKNGRIGKAQSLLGTLLNVKPLLTLDEGVVSPLDKVRGKRKVIPRLVNLIVERVPVDQPVKLGVAHGGAPEQAVELAEQLKQYYHGAKALVGMVGPVIGCHTGPGVLAVVSFPAQ